MQRIPMEKYGGCRHHRDCSMDAGPRSRGHLYLTTLGVSSLCYRSGCCRSRRLGPGFSSQLGAGGPLVAASWAATSEGDGSCHETKTKASIQAEQKRAPLPRREGRDSQSFATVRGHEEMHQPHGAWFEALGCESIGGLHDDGRPSDQILLPPGEEVFDPKQTKSFPRWCSIFVPELHLRLIFLFPKSFQVLLCPVLFFSLF